MTTKTEAERQRPPRRAAQAARNAERRKQEQRRLAVRVAIGSAAILALLFALTLTGGGDGDTSGAINPGGGPRFDVGHPGPGQQAPTFELPSSAGGTFDLADARGENVLLYFQEGIMCQPCWTQITDMEKRFEDFEALGVDRLVSITVDPLDLLRQKVADEGIQSEVLSDPSLSLADDYQANQYGMMGTSMYGHTFVLVGPDGTIRWRADYGGKPDYTMYLEPDDLLEDMAAGRTSGGAEEADPPGGAGG
ncbi:MAG: peroxiredoxin family protein [Actinobacteria bacterium]|nr:peroxiredoxin family protein [Actinomycetota bacterium]